MQGSSTVCLGDGGGAFKVRGLDTGEAKPREYRVYLPDGYDASGDRRWPVLISLHGSGERGFNNSRATVVGLGAYLITKKPRDFPFITIFPQVSNMWFTGKHEAWIWRMLDAVEAEFRTDSQRVYMTGFSMGGYGTWDLSMRHPDRLAAIAPICGGAHEAALIGNLRGMPVWAFHGEIDPNVPVAASRELIQALRDGGETPRYTEYRRTGHACWDKTYETPDLYRWLLSHERRRKPAEFTYILPRNGRTLPWTIWWFRFDSVEARAARVAVKCRVEADRIMIATEGVTELTLLPDAMPIDTNKPMNVYWNGVSVHQGKLDRELRLSQTAGPPRRGADDDDASSAGRSDPKGAPDSAGP